MDTSKYDVEIKINQEEVLLNPFLKTFYTSILLGSIQALKDIPENVDFLTINVIKKS